MQLLKFILRLALDRIMNNCAMNACGDSAGFYYFEGRTRSNRWVHGEIFMRSVWSNMLHTLSKSYNLSGFLKFLKLILSSGNTANVIGMFIKIVQKKVHVGIFG